jgi:hypothetical protein
MKFKDYLLLETPLLVDLENGSEYVIKIFNALKKQRNIKRRVIW